LPGRWRVADDPAPCGPVWRATADFMIGCGDTAI